jgi:hypothetical protein
MAIEFKCRGKTWRGDPAEEGTALRRQAEGQDGQVGIYEDDEIEVREISVHVNPGDTNKFEEPVDGKGELQRILLEALTAEYAVPSSVLVRDLESESELALAGHQRSSGSTKGQYL